MSVILRLEQLGKAFRLGEIGRGVFLEEWRRKLFHRNPAADQKLFWALRDVSFDVKEGEIVGLLGANGAGKSTLLKVVSQITAPTCGSVKLRGRVASLLEVGTGFHPELTGRDNVFLNGVILGMTRREIAGKFDEIVDFAGISEFIDTPVKRYSVGMRVRLAFAIAAQLEPEILAIDEVLAVGDAAFQQKCLGKIGEVSRSGRTVLFVSHNAAAIESLCTRGIVLEKGRVVFDGTQSDAIEAYAAGRVVSSNDLRLRTDRAGSGEVRVVQLELRDGQGAPISVTRAGDDLEIVLHFERHAAATFPRIAVEITIFTHLGAAVFTQGNWFGGTGFGDLPERGAFVCRIPRLPLPVGHFRIGFRIAAEVRGRRNPFDAIESAAELHVEPGDFFGTGKLPPLKAGVCLVEGTWRLETAPAAALVP